MFSYFNDLYINMMFGYSFIVTEAIFASCAVVLLEKIELKTKTLLLLIPKIAGTWIVMILLDSLVYWIFGRTYNREVAYPVLLALYCVLLCRYKPCVRLMTAASYYSVYVIALDLSEKSAGLIENQIGMQTPASTIAVAVIVFLAMVYFKIFSLEQFNHVPVAMSVMAAVLPLVGAAISIFVNYLDTDLFAPAYSITISASFLVVDLGCYLLFWMICRSYSQAEDLKIRQKQTEMDRDFLRLSESNLNELRSLRHDFKNHYSYIRMLLENKEYDKALSYFSKLDARYTEAVSYVSSGNRTIDTILNLEKIKAKQDSVDLDLQQLTVPQKVSIEDSDLTSIITNLVDNAIEHYCATNTQGKVEVRIEQYGNYMFITVRNALAETDEKERVADLKTTKKDSSLHGYGTRIVRNLAKKYSGCATFGVDNNLFTANVMLYSPVDDQDGAAMGMAS